MPAATLNGPVQLTGVTTLSPANVWAVGCSLSGGQTSLIIEHFDGSTWTQQQGVPSPGSSSNDPEGAERVAPLADVDSASVPYMSLALVPARPRTELTAPATAGHADAAGRADTVGQAEVSGQA